MISDSHIVDGKIAFIADVDSDDTCWTIGVDVSAGNGIGAWAWLGVGTGCIEIWAETCCSNFYFINKQVAVREKAKKSWKFK